MDRVVSLDQRELIEALGAMADRAVDLSEPMAVIAESLVSEVNDKFEMGGPGWPDLADSTKASRRGTSAQILVDTGRLAGSIQAESGADYAEAATDVEYAVYHVSDAPRSKIPLRDFFDLDDRVFEEAAQTLVEHLAQ